MTKEKPAPLTLEARSRVLTIPLPRDRMTYLEVPTPFDAMDMMFVSMYVEWFREAIITENSRPSTIGEWVDGGGI